MAAATPTLPLMLAARVPLVTLICWKARLPFKLMLPFAADVTVPTVKRSVPFISSPGESWH